MVNPSSRTVAHQVRDAVVRIDIVGEHKAQEPAAEGHYVPPKQSVRDFINSQGDRGATASEITMALHNEFVGPGQAATADVSKVPLATDINEMLKSRRRQTRLRGTELDNVHTMATTALKQSNQVLEYRVPDPDCNAEDDAIGLLWLLVLTTPLFLAIAAQFACNGFGIDAKWRTNEAK